MIKNSLNRWVLVLVTLLSIQHLEANKGQVVELNLNDDDLELNIARVKSWSRNSQTYFGAGFLSSYHKESEKKLSMADLTMTHVGITEIPGIGFGLGFKYIYSDLDAIIKKREANALAIRLKMMYTLPIVVRSVVGLTVNYAPSSLVFSDNLDRFREYRLELNFEPIEGGWIYFGYRHVGFDFDDRKDEVELSDSTYIGMKLYF